jgi:hypothetical protein
MPLMHLGPYFARGLRHLAGGAVVTGRFPGGPSRRPTAQRAGAVHPGEIALASPMRSYYGATIGGQPVGHRPPGPTDPGLQASPSPGGRSALAVEADGWVAYVRPEMSPTRVRSTNDPSQADIPPETGVHRDGDCANGGTARDRDVELVAQPPLRRPCRFQTQQRSATRQCS